MKNRAYRSCAYFRCGYVTAEIIETCPKCGSHMRTSGRVRLIGVVQLLLGLFLIGFMGTITFYVAPMMLDGGESDSGTTFTGTAQQATFILILFGMVIAVGAGAALSGLWQIISGRTNKWLAIATIVICAVLLVFAYSLELILDW